MFTSMALACPHRSYLRDASPRVLRLHRSGPAHGDVLAIPRRGRDAGVTVTGRWPGLLTTPEPLGPGARLTLRDATARSRDRLLAPTASDCDRTAPRRSHRAQGPAS